MTYLSRRLPLFFATLLIALCTDCSAAEQKGDGENQSVQQTLAKESLDDLQRDRNTLESEIQSLQTEIDDFGKDLYWVNKKEAADMELHAAEARHAQEPELSALRAAARDAAKDVSTTLKSIEIAAKIEKNRSVLEGKKSKKAAVETEIGLRVNLEKPKQDFKKQISLYCAFLIGIVILGFFVIAYGDAVVRREIFSGQAGIQFITLFSLVIAIILFGITGVLEGKELSALLGGLSGYILGRSSSAKPSTPAQDGAQTPQNPKPPGGQ